MSTLLHKQTFSGRQSHAQSCSLHLMKSRLTSPKASPPWSNLGVKLVQAQSLPVYVEQRGGAPAGKKKLRPALRLWLRLARPMPSISIHVSSRLIRSRTVVACLLVDTHCSRALLFDIGQEESLCPTWYRRFQGATSKGSGWYSDKVDLCKGNAI